MKSKRRLSESIKKSDLDDNSMSESGNPLNNLKHQNNYMIGHIEECEFEESHNVGLASHRNDFKKNCNNSRQKK